MRSRKTGQRVKKLLLFLLVAIFFSSMSGRCTAEEVSWEEAWRIITDKSPSLKATLYAVEVAKASLKLAGAGKRISADLAVTEAMLEGASDSFVGGITLSYSLNLAGKEELEIASARIAYEEALLAYRISQLQLFRNASFAYWNAVAANAALRAAEEEIKKREAFLKDAKLRYEQGVVPQLDVLRAESALAEAKASYASKRAIRENYYAMLKGLAGWTDIEPLKEAFEKVEVPIREQAPNYSGVVERHPSVALQSLKVARNEILVKLAKSGMAPKVSISGTRNLFKEGSSSASSSVEDRWSAQATLSIPLSDGGKTKWSVSQAKAQLNIARAELGKEKAAVMEELFSAWEDYRSALEDFASSKKRLELVAREREISVLRYNEGLSSQLDVLDAQSRYADSLANYINAKKKVLVSYSRLDAAEGRLP
ncbi:outer membrane efflux protein [Thermovirga lienii DSM 17291]|uniref:Outer membrane efflux protein n=1 Tax=Thermovirga lienii (strain ATCC BAA-1197 / DSM 17291 / Cas60314) TaxID=580340 RepID=G7V9I8_THELD|nr:TolC family protein [Thermovirga lienii]AER66538.1 outer membrane efflux protein [Thermovirga lienii DSM 17291]